MSSSCIIAPSSLHKPNFAARRRTGDLSEQSGAVLSASTKECHAETGLGTARDGVVGLAKSACWRPFNTRWDRGYPRQTPMETPGPDWATSAAKYPLQVMVPDIIKISTRNDLTQAMYRCAHVVQIIVVVVWRGYPRSHRLYVGTACCVCIVSYRFVIVSES